MVTEAQRAAVTTHLTYELQMLWVSPNTQTRPVRNA
jgi:hypothetical protein